MSSSINNFINNNNNNNIVLPFLSNQLMKKLKC